MNSREIVVRGLEEVIYNKAYSNIVLDKALSDNNISQVDKHFITKIFHGVLGNYYLLDYKVKKLNDGKMKRKIYLILLVALYQLDYMDNTPAYSIIDESNKLSKTLVDGFAAKFVNALLRKYLDNKIEIKIDDFPNQYQYFSIKYSIPEFIIRLLEKQYGLENLTKILESSLKNALTNVRVNLNKTSKEELINSSYYRNGNLANDSLIYIGKDRKRLNEDFKKGLVSIQDEAGQLIAPLLELKETDLVLDMCAAPGSKTCHMGELMHNKGKIVAIDLYPHRLDLLLKASSRLGLTNIVTKDYDSGKLSDIYDNELFDKILLDAPCSGLGVIRRKMDIKYNVTPESLDELVLLQEKLINEAYKLLKIGGILVYSTCTLNKKENEKQIQKFIESHLDMKIIEEKTILPFEKDSDGFYYCKMIKEEK